MKSHWTTYILFVVVVIIWGLVAKRIFFDKPERPNIISESDIKSDYAEYSYETDTLLCNYADPFQIESKLPQERKPNALKKNSLSMKNKRKKVLMHYFGSVRSGKMLLHIVDINDACYEVSIGDRVNGFELKSVDDDSIYFEKDGMVYSLSRNI